MTRIDADHRKRPTARPPETWPSVQSGRRSEALAVISTSRTLTRRHDDRWWTRFDHLEIQCGLLSSIRVDMKTFWSGTISGQRLQFMVPVAAIGMSDRDVVMVMALSSTRLAAINRTLSHCDPHKARWDDRNARWRSMSSGRPRRAGRNEGRKFFIINAGFATTNWLRENPQLKGLYQNSKLLSGESVNDDTVKKRFATAAPAWRRISTH